MTISRFGGSLALCGAIMAFVGFMFGADAYQESAETLGYYFGGWLGVALAVVGFCIWMSTPRGKPTDT